MITISVEIAPAKTSETRHKMHVINERQHPTRETTTDTLQEDRNEGTATTDRDETTSTRAVRRTRRDENRVTSATADLRTSEAETPQEIIETISTLVADQPSTQP